MAIQLEEVRARLIADTAQFQAALKAADGALGNFTGNLPHANRTLTTVKNSMASFAFQAAGIPGPLGKISTALLTFAGGSGLVLGVVAGLGAISLAYNALTKDAEAARKATEDLIAAQLKQRQEERTEDIRGRERLAQLREASRVAQQGFQAARERVARERQREATGTMRGEAPADVAGAVRDLTEAQTRYNDALMAYNRQLRETHGIETAAAREARLKAEAKEQQDIADAVAATAQEARGLAADIQHKLIPAFQALEDIALKEAFKAQKFPASIAVPKENMEAVGKSIKSDLTKLLGDKKAQQEFHQIGQNVGRILAEGVMDGFSNLSGIMRSLFAQVLSFALGQGIGALLGGGGGKAKVAIGEGKGTGIINPLPVVGPASMGLSIDVSGLPKAVTPFDMARDAQWLRVLRDGLVSAKSAGFRFS